MLKLSLSFVFAAIFLLSVSPLTANATIGSIASDACPNPACLPSRVQPVVQGTQQSMTVKGQYVDLSTEVQVTGSGVSASYGTRTHGSGSSIVIRFTVSDSASLGERTVKLRYAIETDGPDTFTIKVVRGGTVSKIEQRVPLLVLANPNITTPGTGITFPGAGSGSGSGTAPTRLVAANAIPVNQTVTLVFTGDGIGNAVLRDIAAIRNVQKLPGCTETKCEFEMEFTQTGSFDLNLYDAGIGNAASSTLFHFFYGGAERVTVLGAASGNTGGGFIPPPLTGGGSTPSTFLDAAPRANMLNIFRRQSQNASFVKNGVSYFSINSEGFCNGMIGEQTKIITVPNPTWGASNVGTGNIAVPFTVQFFAGGVLTDTQLIATLSTGQTRDFVFQRPDSKLRVFTFLDRGGCFVSTTADEFFEDPQFEVRVDTGANLAESNEFNNTRIY